MTASVPWWRRWLPGAAPPPAPDAPPTPSRDAPADGPVDRVEAALAASPPSAETVAGAIREAAAAGASRAALGVAVRAALARPLPEAVTRELVALADRLGELGLARRVVDAARDRAPGSPAMHALAAELAERAGDRGAARRATEELLLLDFGYPGARERAERLGDAPLPEPALDATLLAGGAVLGERYRVEREVGRGGAGIVFAAWDAHLDRRVALKIAHASGPRARARLRVEALTPASIPHPGVVRVLDRPAGLVGLVMEWLPGGAIREALARGPLDPARARRWLVTAADALAHVHRAGVVHRDVKPSNLLLRADDRVVLTDFGASRRVGEVGGGDGTLAYMAPEERAGAPAAPAADVWALGRVLDELRAAVGAAAPEGWEALAAAMRAPAPGERPSAAQVASALRAAPGASLAGDAPPG